MDTNIQIHNKTLIASTKSRKSIQSFKTLGITTRRFYSAKDRTKERYKKAGDRMRERYRKARGLQKNGRLKRRVKHRKRR
ncbi:MAG: hypothetical protein WCI72_05635 [archaeon]